MNLIELSFFIQNETAAQEYLIDQKILKKFSVCLYCRSEKIGDIRRNRMKCYVCKKEWHKRKGSFLESRHISDSKFIGLLKLYASEFTIDQISYELALDRKTVAGIISDIQKRILPDYPRQINSKAILYPKGKRVELKFLNDRSSVETNDYIELKFIRYKEYGSIYSFLVHSTRKHGKNQYSVLDRFLSFAKMKLIVYRGIDMDYVHQYLSELIIKFNLGDSDFYEYVLKMLNFQRVVETTQSL